MRTVLLIGIVLAASGCARTPNPPGSPHKEAAEPAASRPVTSKPTELMSREDFKKAFLGLTLDEVRKKLGAPDDIERAGPEDPLEGYWRYQKKTVNPETKQPDQNVYLWWQRDRV